uniref:Uncharacterized protein n=1 Tax=Arundo donax TaxID=35708 RepID=A0A0A9GWR7_ARUDO
MLIAAKKSASLPTQWWYQFQNLRYFESFLGLRKNARICKMPSTSTNMPRPLCAGTLAWIRLYNDTPATMPARPRMKPTNWMPAWR